MAATNGTSFNFNNSSTIPLWLDGKEITTSTTFDLVSPLDERFLYKSSAASEEDAHTAVASAAKALSQWSKTPPSERRDILQAAAVELASRKEEFRHYSTTETGATPPMFEFDFNDALEALKTCAGLIHEASGGMVPTIGDPNRSAMVVREPYGVVMSIATWNAPCILGLRAFLAPIAMGNTVVLKGSERCPACYWALASVFHKAGLPPGVLNTIIHRAEDGRTVIPALVKSPTVRKISFTGSAAVGSIVASLAGKQLKPALMELGGKAPAIVCEDANIETAALQCTLGAFLYSGQICMATERIIVHSKIAEPFRQALKGTIDAVFGDPNGLVLVDKAPVAKNKQLVDDAVSKGAKLTHGDAAQNLQLSTAMKPIVLEGVKEGMDLYHTESFGPTVSLLVVDSDEEAIKIANDTSYGLASSVFSESLQHALKIARQIETGAVHINAMTVHDEVHLPHGGAKQSGYGRFNGLQGMYEWTRLKCITWAN